MINLKPATRFATTAIAILLLGTIAAEAADNDTNGGSTAQQNCEQQANNDFNVNVNSCNNVLSDLPSQNAQCISDAKDQRARDLAACKAQALTGGNLGLIGGLSVAPGIDGGHKGKGKLSGLVAVNPLSIYTGEDDNGGFKHGSKGGFATDTDGLSNGGGSTGGGTGGAGGLRGGNFNTSLKGLSMNGGSSGGGVIQ